MRKLVILLGASASGKSTWIKNRHLEDYSLSANSIRKNLGYNTFSVVGDVITSIVNLPRTLVRGRLTRRILL